MRKQFIPYYFMLKMKSKNHVPINERHNLNQTESQYLSINNLRIISEQVLT